MTVLMVSLSMNWLTTSCAGRRHDRAGDEGRYPRPDADPGWTFCVDGYDPLLENSVEFRFAISNGFLGIRGARSTTRGERWVVPARTYVAGLFDTSGPSTPRLDSSPPPIGCGFASWWPAVRCCIILVICRRIT